MADASGTAATTRELDVEKPYLWRVFRRVEPGEPLYMPASWVEVGSIAGKYSYVCPPPQEIGGLTGLAGEYMLIHDGRVTFMRIAQTEPRFEEVEEGE